MKVRPTRALLSQLPHKELLLLSQIRQRLVLFSQVWIAAFRQVFPLYISIQVVLLVISLYAPSTMILAQHPDWSSNSLRVLWRAWFRWDTVHYINLAQNGYPPQFSSDVAFFPLFPLLVHGLTFLIPNALIAGLLLSHLASLILMLVLYQLVKEELGEKAAGYALLCLIIFPTALFLWAAYPESLFLCLTTLSFYTMRHRSWWQASIFGLFACLARPNGILLLLPFCFEYLRQHDFRWRAIRWDALSALLLPVGLLLYMLYCAVRYGDPLAFSHAQSFWQRKWNYPWYGMIKSIEIALGSSNVLRALLMLSLDLLPNLLALAVITISLLGRNRLGSRHWTYTFYALALWLFNNSNFGNTKPLLGVGRNTLMILPLYLMLGLLASRFRWFRSLYLPLAGALCFFWLILFLTGYIVD